jgi:hypothetical protein
VARWCEEEWDHAIGHHHRAQAQVGREVIDDQVEQERQEQGKERCGQTHGQRHAQEKADTGPHRGLPAARVHRELEIGPEAIKDQQRKHDSKEIKAVQLGVQGIGADQSRPPQDVRESRDLSIE